jgi:hypothetical protein
VSDEKKNPLEFMNRPPFFIGGITFALLCGVMKWIAWEYVFICVAAGGTGIYLHYKKQKNTTKDSP